jgi:hypothetical protein
MGMATDLQRDHGGVDQGKTYPVKVQGLSVSELGVNRAEVARSVFNLKALEEFSGNYTAAGAGSAK